MFKKIFICLVIFGLVGGAANLCVAEYKFNQIVSRDTSINIPVFYFTEDLIALPRNRGETFDVQIAMINGKYRQLDQIDIWITYDHRYVSLEVEESMDLSEDLGHSNVFIHGDQNKIQLWNIRGGKLAKLRFENEKSKNYSAVTDLRFEKIIITYTNGIISEYRSSWVWHDPPIIVFNSKIGTKLQPWSKKKAKVNEFQDGDINQDGIRNWSDFRLLAESRRYGETNGNYLNNRIKQLSQDQIDRLRYSDLNDDWRVNRYDNLQLEWWISNEQDFVNDVNRIVPKKWSDMKKVAVKK